MEFFDKLGKKATEAYKITADKTGKIAKETKMKLKIAELKNQINDIYEVIGKKVYEKHTLGEENIDIKVNLEEECTKIDVMSDEIDELLKECMELKDKKQCPKCYTEIEKENKFCPKCGEKQPEEPAEEVEIIEEVKTEVAENENAGNPKDSISIEATEPKVENINENENNKKEQNQKESKSAEDLEETVKIESDVESEKTDNK